MVLKAGDVSAEETFGGELVGKAPFTGTAAIMLVRGGPPQDGSEAEVRFGAMRAQQGGLEERRWRLRQAKARRAPRA